MRSQNDGGWVVGVVAAGFIVGGEVGVSYYSLHQAGLTLLLQRKFNSKTPNIYIANIVNKIGLLWKSF